MSDAHRTIVIADPTDPGALDLLKDEECRVIDASSGASALNAALSDAWALVVRSRTKVTAELIAHAPHLALIARAGVGVDNIDLAAAAARKIRVVNAPVAATTSVAELTVALALMLVRELWPSVAGTKAGRWERGTRGGELAGRTVGFVGYGRIAREVARRLAPFDVHALAYDPYVPRTEDGTSLVALDELFGQSDLVSLHAAATPENRHLINTAALARMKRGSFLINVARGSLVDEAALLAALRSGQLAGAALDVYEVEPPMNPELLGHPRVIATPHVGASTYEAQRRAGRQVMDEVRRALRGEALTAQVPIPGGSA